MDAKSYLEDYAKQAGKYLKKFFAEKSKEASKIDKLAVEVLGTLENYISGGKKIRGALTVLGYQITGGKRTRDILPVSAAVEIVHSALLIHDDFIDKDRFRRGKPTVHEIYAKGNSEHYGASIALIIGDIGIFLSNQILASSNFDAKMIIKATSEFENLLIKTGYGEILDIAFDSKKSTTWGDILKVRTYKTAYYTIVMPLTVGAILGGAKDKTLKAIENYGVPVGIAFQLADDILGVFGKSDKTGKSSESDIREGKKTLLFVKALELARDKERQFLLKWYGSDKLDKNKIEKIRQAIKDSGSLDYSRKLAEEMAEKGKKYIPKITGNLQFRETLSSLADFMVYRSK